jgi:hypothetical protein
MFGSLVFRCLFTSVDAITSKGYCKGRRQRDIIAYMFCGRVPIAALTLILLTVGTSMAAAPAQKHPTMSKAVKSAVRSACDAAYAIAANTSGVSVLRRTGSFRDETLQKTVFGCGLAISGSFDQAGATGDAASRLHQSFYDQGWQEMPAYSADGTDGTSFAFRKAGVACLVRGKWDGGSADDPDIPAQDWYQVEVFCTSPVFPENRWLDMNPTR